ncbi:phosphoribosylformylglycinamidine synthase subunit PurL, partial [Acinetobacter baumannii]|nr:phosphoribosylformylglycinamidine synthase subunit PurL [Acinetobacter baumannii]
QDLGGAGLACATSELAAAGDGGMHIDLDRVPLRAEGMTPAEVLSSESQERMCAVVAPENLDKFYEICAKWDVTAAEIGEVIDEKDRYVVYHNGEVVVDAPASTIDEGPVYERPFARPEWQDELQRLQPVERPEDLKQALLDMVSSPA